MAERNRLEVLKWFGATRALTRDEAWWLIEQAEEADQVKEAYEDRIGDIGSLLKSLREIYNQIRPTSIPIPHIVQILKDSLPEYQEE